MKDDLDHRQINKRLQLYFKAIPDIFNYQIPAKIILARNIITDNVKQAKELTKELEERSDLDRMIDKIKTVL